MKPLLDWLFTIPFLAAFGLVLVFFDPLQRVARLFGQRPQEIMAGSLQTGLVWAFRICGTRIEVERSPEVRPWSSYVLISNHQSLFDIPILGAILFSNFPKYVSKRELASWIPSISYNLRRGGNAIIDRKDRAQALAEIRALGRRIAERNVSAVIYPEGTRSRRGELGAFTGFPAGLFPKVASDATRPYSDEINASVSHQLAANVTTVPTGAGTVAAPERPFV